MTRPGRLRRLGDQLAALDDRAFTRPAVRRLLLQLADAARRATATTPLYAVGIIAALLHR